MPFSQSSTSRHHNSNVSHRNIWLLRCHPTGRMTTQRPFQGSRFEQSTAAAFAAHQYRIHGLAGSVTEPLTNRDDESEFVRIVEDVVGHNSTHGLLEEYLAIAVPHFELAW